MAARKKGGLGKGIDALITPTVKKEADQEKVIEKVVEKTVELYLKIDEIEPNRLQPRKNFDEDALQELSESI